MVESRRVPSNSIIRAIIEKLSGRVSKKGRIIVNTGKWKNPGEYREKVESWQLLKNCPDEFRKRVEFGRVLGKGRIRRSTEKLSRRVLENGRMSVSTGKW